MIETRGQQRFVHGNDIRFTIRTDRKVYNIGEQITIHYTIENISNGALFVPATQWEITCGTPPHLWSQLEDSSGKHYEPGYGGSCLHPVPDTTTGISDRMRKDALLLGPGRSVTGSFRYDSNVFADKLKPGRYRMEAVLYGWNLRFDNSQLAELARMGAPFLTGEGTASSPVELRGDGR